MQRNLFMDNMMRHPAAARIKPQRIDLVGIDAKRDERLWNLLECMWADLPEERPSIIEVSEELDRIVRLLFHHAPALADTYKIPQIDNAGA